MSFLRIPIFILFLCACGLLLHSLSDISIKDFGTTEGMCAVTINDITITNLTCNDSSDGELLIDATGTALTGNLEYSIDGGTSFFPTNNFTDLMPGNYVIVIQDDADPACSAMVTVTINAPLPLVANPPPPFRICYSLSPATSILLNQDEVENALTASNPALDANWYFDMAGNIPLDPASTSDIITLVNNGQTTIYATVASANCESNTVSVAIELNPYAAPNPVSMSVCDNGNGQGVFDLTSLENDVLGGQTGTVSFYEDAELTLPITPADNYLSTPGIVYVSIDDGSGCVGEPAEVTLSVITLSPDAFFLSLDPVVACDDATVQVTLNASDDPVNDYVFAISYGPIATGPNNSTTITGSDGETNFNLGITESHLFTLNSVTGPGPEFCVLTFDPPLEYFVEINESPAALPTTLTACPDGQGQGNFDLTSVEDMINGGSGDLVFFYEDAALNTPITEPFDYLSTSTIIFAVVQDANGCLSDPAQVTLLLEAGPFPVNLSLDISSSCDPTTVVLTFVLPPGPVYDLDLLVTDGNGTAPTTLTGVGNGDQLSLMVDETTTFSIDSITSSTGCTFALIIRPSVTFMIGSDVIPNPASLDECDTGNGVATFDLTQADATVNGNSGDPVLWFLDENGDIPLNDPTSILSSGNVVYAAIDDGNCISELVPVVLTVSPLPDLAINFDSPISCSGANDGSISIAPNTPPPYLFDWNDDQYDGLRILNDLGPGIYAITLTDGSGCQGFAEIEITEPPVLELACTVANSETSAGANDGLVDYVISGGTALYSVTLNGPLNTTVNNLTEDIHSIDNLPPGDYQLNVTDANGCTANCNFTINTFNCNLDYTLNATDISCNGANDGTISVVINDGVPGYTYDWSNDLYDGMDQLTNLDPGTYTVTVSDANGCAVTQSVNIEEPNLLRLFCLENSAGQGNGLGSYRFIYNGGTPLYFLDLNGPLSTSFTETAPGIWDSEVLLAGEYTFTVTDINGCSRSCTFTVVFCDLELSLTGSPPKCSSGEDGIIDLQITGSHPVTSINWNYDLLDGLTFANDLEAGYYFVTVTDDQGCVAVDSILLEEPAPLVSDCSTIVSPSSPTDSDGSIDFAVIGGTPPYSITWMGPANGSGTLAGPGNFLIDNLPAGTYVISVQDANGCIFGCSSTLNSTLCDLVLNLQGTPPTCGDPASGSLDLTINSSFPIVSIDWNVDAFDGSEDQENVTAGTYTVTVTDTNGCTVTATRTLIPAAILIDCSQVTSPTTPGGTDGSTDIIVSNGTPPYQVSWNGPVSSVTVLDTDGTLTITDLTVGAYSLTVLDAEGCEATCNFVLINNDNCNFNLALSGTSPTCTGGNDGTINLELTGGTPDYTFIWNDSALNGQGPAGNQTGLSAGNYSVTVIDSNNCIVIDDFTLTEPDTILFSCQVNTPPSDETASDGSITIDFLSGPGGPYTLSYDNGMGTMGSQPITPGVTTLDNLPAGNYTITISTFDCAASCTTELSFLCTFDLSITATPEQCLSSGDGTAIAQPEGGTLPYTYAWSNTENTQLINDLTTNTYTVTVTDGEGCVAIANTTITASLPLPTASLGSGSTICADSCYQLPVTFTGSPSYTLTYRIIDDSGPLALQQIFFLANQDSFPICPTDLGLSAGDFTLQLLQLDDTNCANMLDQSIAFTSLPSATGVLNSMICPEDSILVGTEYFGANNLSGEVVLWGAANSGCDSTVIVDLLLFSTTLLVEDDLCQGDTIIYGGEAFYAGNSSDTILLANASSHGCDSTIIVNLNEINPGINNISTVLCAGDTLIVDGEIFDEFRPSGMVELPDQASNGCDSLIMVDLEIIPLSIRSLDLMICAGDSVVVGDSTLMTTGMYEIRIPNAAATGCDSIVALNLEVIDLPPTLLSVTICPGDSIDIENITLYDPGTYIVIFTAGSVDGCDSIVQIQLTHLPLAESSFTGTYCLEDEVMVGDSLFTATNSSGTVVVTGGGSNGCDSLILVDLDFRRPEGILTGSYCLEDEVMVGDSLFMAANPAGAVLLAGASSDGCDSLVLVDLEFRPSPEGSFTGTYCLEDEVMIGDSLFTASQSTGTVLLAGASSNGCDSLVFVNLEFRRPEGTFTDTFCLEAEVMVGDSLFTAANPSGTVLLPGASSQGCDSLVLVDLEFLLLPEGTFTDTFCLEAEVMVGDSLFTAANPSGTVLLPGASSDGCDSLVFVNINFRRPEGTFTGSYCLEDEVMVGDSLFTADRTSGSVLLADASSGGCDSLVLVDLEFRPTPTGLFTETYCIDEEVVVGDSTFTAAHPSGSVRLAGASAEGCDSIVMVNLIFVPGNLTNLDTLLCFGESLTIGDQLFNRQNPTGIVVLDNAAANGCDSTIFVTTTTLPELFASLGPDTTVCAGQPLNVVVDLTPGATYDFTLQTSNGTLLEEENVPGGEFTFNLGTIESDLTLELIVVTSSAGCPVTITNNAMTIRYSNTQFTLTSVGGTDILDVTCADSEDGSILTEIQSGIGPFTYQWNTGQTTASIDGLEQGIYTLTVTDLPGCSVERTITLLAPPALEAQLEAIATECFGTSTGNIVIDTIIGGTGPYEYSLDNQFFNGAGDYPNLFADLAAGTYTIYLQDANDCQASTIIDLPNPEQLVLDLGPDVTIQAGDSVLLDPTLLFEVASWTWTPTTNLSRPDSTTTYASPLESTFYQLEITDLSGCTTSDIIQIIVERNINVYIPTAFSPDGDGNNDELTIFAGPGVVRIENFQIFDRWGNQVFDKGPFQPNDPAYGWDGTLNGERMNPAVFAYFVQVRMATGEVVLLEGGFVLMR